MIENNIDYIQISYIHMKLKKKKKNQLFEINHNIYIEKLNSSLNL